jgi:hypothetical protein
MSFPRSLRCFGLGLLLFLPTLSCASLDTRATSSTSGEFSSSAFSITFLSFDLPSPALQVARNNAADINQPNLLVERETVFPYLGRLDWLLDIISFRFAKVSGTWGDPPEPAAPVADLTE